MTCLRPAPWLLACVLATALPALARAAALAPPCTLLVSAADTIRAADLSHEDCAIRVNSGGALVVIGPHRFESVVVSSGGVLTSALLDSLTLAVTGDMTIAAGGRVRADGRGFAAATGPGAGVNNSVASGGSHAGRGGWNATAASGPTYDAFVAPSQPGSGGGSDVNLGGRGGGAVRLAVGGTLRVDGELAARGDSAISTSAAFDPGGGAGGSIAVSAGTLTGTGLLDASGGRGGSLGGGGGGGAVSATFGANSFTGVMRATGGAGANALTAGAAGTVWTKLASASLGTLRVDNGGLVTRRAMEPVDSVTTVPGSLLVRAGGIVSTPVERSLSLAVQGDATVEANAAIAADGRGFAAGSGPGAGAPNSLATGASHGGRGGWSGNAASGPTYGDFLAPSQWGSGGGSDVNVGGRGGGALRLVVSGVLRVDGDVSARGDSAVSTGAAFDPGGGAGGSVWATAGALAGAGAFDASGGRGGALGGGGGGGRIAAEFGASTFTGAWRASGGAGATASSTGGAGTTWTRDTDEALGELRVDNGGLVTRRAAECVDSVTLVPGALRVRRGGIVSGPLERSLAITVQGAATVEPDGAITLDGRGYPPQSGPGAGSPNVLASGASHGGRGGGVNNAASGPTYDAFAAPTMRGSGGGNDVGLGGRGGGALRLIVSGALLVNGEVSARGDSGNAVATGADPGGGAGGSVWVTAGSLAGAGVFDASGGRAGNLGGGGGGGRIAVEYASSAFAGSLRAAGGTGPSQAMHGGAGTAWLRDTDEALGELRVDNGGIVADAITEMPDSITTVPGHVRVRGRGVLGIARRTSLHLAVLGDANIEADGAISVAGRGYDAGEGPGAGVPGSRCSGGSHAGRGGGGNAGNPSGPTYGFAPQPVTYGSGGGTDVNLGGSGGGVLRLDVAGTLRVDGTVSARGQTPASYGPGFDPGGGAGGSLWMSAAVVTGTGSLDASGGDGGGLGGGGGGGRVALTTFCFDGFSGEQIRVAGGRGGDPPAGAGTIVPDFARGVAAGVIAEQGAARGHGQPLSLADDAFESADSLWAIGERRDVFLASPLPVDLATPAVVADTAQFTAAALDSGLWVDSHVLHFDPPAGGGRVRGAVTFDTNVLGVMVTGATMAASDGRLGAPGMPYPDATTRGAEFGGADGDTIELSADRRTVTFATSVANGADEIRVITAVPLATCGAVADAGPAAGAAPSRVTFAAPAPNPSRGAVTMRFALPRAMHARLDVLDVAGRRVATLADGERSAGEHALTWWPGAARPGVYFARLATPEGVSVRTVVRVE